jgi:hypothetical protein
MTAHSKKFNITRYKLMKMLDESFQNDLLQLMAYYHSKACPCAFPRFRTLISCDLPAILLEKEALIKLARLDCDVEELSERSQKFEHWACKTCHSTFYANFQPLLLLPGRWENRTLVRRNQLLCVDIGEEPATLIPLCLQTLPRYELKDMASMVTKPEFIQYMRKLK